jgi:RND superfamily putative drug exporter
VGDKDRFLMRGLGVLLTRHARLALFGFIGLVFASSFLGFQSFGNLAGGGYEDPNGDSQKVEDLLFSEFDIDPAEVVVLADLDDDATEQSSIDTVSALNKEFANLDGVVSVEDYYTLGNPESLLAEDGKLVYIFVDLDNDVDPGSIVETIVDDYTGSYLTAEVHVAGYEAITKALNETIYSDIITAELIAVPLAILLLVFVFGTLVAAGLPLMVGALAIIGSFFVVWIFSQFTEMSVFSLNLITGLGLGLGIDYSLLVINRWREERANGLSIDEATIKTVETAGRTVFFSGLTVAVTLLSLGFFPQFFLQSFAISGFTVVAMAALHSQLHCNCLVTG